MASNRTSNTLRNMLAGYLYGFVHMFMPFITRSIILQVLGTEYLGLNTLFNSIFAFLNLAEFGFASALTYKMYKPASEGDYETLSIYATIIRKVYLVVGGIILVLGILVIPFLPRLISGDCPSDINLYVLYMVYLANTVIPYLGFGYCTSIFCAFQRTDIANIINAALVLFMNIMQIAVLLVIRKYYPYLFCLPFFTLINTFLLVFIQRRHYSRIKINKYIDKGIIKSTFLSAGALFGHNLNYVIVSSADNLVISAFLGLTVLGKYGNYYTILSAVVGLVDVLIQACLPSVGNMMLEENKEHTCQVFKSISLLTYWVSGWCSICLLCLYQPFMRLWMGEDMLLPYSTVALFAAYLYSYKGRSAILLFKNAVGMWKTDWLKPYVSGIVNIFINILLVRIIGLNGVLISTILVFCIINFPWESAVLLKRLMPDGMKKYYSDFLRFLAIVIVAAGCTVFICGRVAVDSDILKLLINAAICIVLPNVIFICLYHQTAEFCYIKEKMKSILNRQGKEK